MEYKVYAKNPKWMLLAMFMNERDAREYFKRKYESYGDVKIPLKIQRKNRIIVRL